ncbi:MAG: class I SAM-dependent methyltransferase [Candidatus Faecenecus gallistercoris]|nr:class I SAM-dependent methyltransferase [Bacillota bacterium]MDD7102096.1 class I SAM-dependent methyltransferase [Bacillota bacterium]MDY4050813.1 class I SAM-dependent methyltransferase [Candidatus Faecenecus gallistercoris]
MLLAKDWKDYELIQTSDGYKLERWKDVYLLRPDPQIIWHQENDFQGKQIHAKYIRSNTGGGHWENLKSTPTSWQVRYKNLTFNIKQMGFKHTGLFPEQAVNWDFMMDKIKRANRSISVLNLFAYTGGATVACLAAGASVVHVDSSRGIVDWCKENVEASGLKDKPVRYIVDDVLKFVKREIRRGHHYDAIIMDPPSYGRGANGEVWSIEKNLNELLNLCVELLSDKPLFFLINSYTTGLSAKVLENMLKILLEPKYQGTITSGEVGLPETNSELVLPCGIYGRFESNE